METVYQIAADIQGQVPVVGVFVDETLDYVHGVAKEVGLDFIQLHGNESPEYCQRIQLPVIKVFRVSATFDARIMKTYDVHAFLFDNYKKSKLGGTGEAFDWNIIDNIQTDTPIILSGGLNIDNIDSSIDTVLLSAVDVSSGVEKILGIKDPEKMKTLFDILSKKETSLKQGILLTYSWYKNFFINN